MHARALIPILAEQFGVEPNTAVIIDRALADGGIRNKGKGRNYPEMTREEALSFLLACMTTSKPTRAFEEVEVWRHARGRVNQPPPKDSSGWDDDDEEDTREVAMHHARMERELASLRDAQGDIELHRYLAALCALIEAGKIAPLSIELKTVISHGTATVTFFNFDNEHVAVDTFKTHKPDAPARRRQFEAEIKTATSVNGSALLEIALRTARPAAMGG